MLAFRAAKPLDQSVKPVLPRMALQGTLQPGLTNSLSGPRIPQVEPGLVEQLCRFRPRINFLPHFVVVAMAGRFLDQIESPGHGNFEITKAALQLIRSDDCRSAVPTCIREAQIDTTAPEYDRHRFALAGWTEVDAGDLREYMPPRPLPIERTYETHNPLRFPSRGGVKAQVVYDLVPIPVEAVLVRVIVIPPSTKHGWFDSLPYALAKERAPIRIKASDEGDIVFVRGNRI